MIRSRFWSLLCLPLAILSMAMFPLGGCRTSRPGRSYAQQNLATLVAAAEAARDSQGEALEAFRGGARRLDGALAAADPDIAVLSRALLNDLARIEGRESAVRALNAKLERTASELFFQWEQDMARMSTPAMRQEAALSLGGTRAAYRQLEPVLASCARQMVGPLQSFRDKALLLKRSPTRQSLKLVGSEKAAMDESLTALTHAVDSAAEAVATFLAALPADSH